MLLLACIITYPSSFVAKCSVVRDCLTTKKLMLPFPMHALLGTCVNYHGRRPSIQMDWRQAGCLTYYCWYYNYPARACASKGLCDRSWCLLYIIYISARTFFYLSKYSLSDAHFSTGRLLFEFNRLQYTLAAPEVFVSSANPVILPSGYRVSIVRNTNIYQIETTPLLYC